MDIKTLTREVKTKKWSKDNCKKFMDLITTSNKLFKAKTLQEIKDNKPSVISEQGSLNFHRCLFAAVSRNKNKGQLGMNITSQILNNLDSQARQKILINILEANNWNVRYFDVTRLEKITM
jgi:hypothetical protein